MTRSVDQSDLDRFRNLIARRLALQFEDGKEELLADVLRQRLVAHGSLSAAAYLASLAPAVDAYKEWRTLAGRLTVSETYFFRVWEQFHALAEAALPARIRVRAAVRKLRILSAGCASGEEPYSVAMLLRERCPELNSWDIEILGFDLSPAAIAKGEKARYHTWSLRDTPAELRDRYFRREGSEFVLNEAIRSMVRLEERNLASRALASAGQFDIILCRNVMMYLVPEAMQSLIARLSQSLAPGGFLFIGYAETLRGLSQDFHLRHTHGAFYYQRREESDQAPNDVPNAIQSSAPAAPLVNETDGARVDAVRRARERIGALTRDSTNRSAPAAELPELRRSPAGLALAFELLRHERFREALEVVPPETGSDPDAQLLQASLLIHCGDLETAESVCRRILATDDLNAGAHYLMALCRENAGDGRAAIEHDRAAIYLDGAFAMPHLHLGRLAKRTSDFVTARRELEDAKLLFPREDPARILLFGGGFSREALVAFSRAELRACGGSS